MIKNINSNTKNTQCVLMYNHKTQYVLKRLHLAGRNWLTITAVVVGHICLYRRRFFFHAGILYFWVGL